MSCFTALYRIQILCSSMNQKLLIWVESKVCHLMLSVLAGSLFPPFSVCSLLFPVSLVGFRLFFCLVPRASVLDSCSLPAPTGARLVSSRHAKCVCGTDLLTLLPKPCLSSPMDTSSPSFGRGLGSLGPSAHRCLLSVPEADDHPV